MTNASGDERVLACELLLVFLVAEAERRGPGLLDRARKVFPSLDDPVHVAIDELLSSATSWTAEKFIEPNT